MKNKRLKIGIIGGLLAIALLAGCAKANGSNKNNCGGDVCHGVISVLVYRH